MLKFFCKFCENLSEKMYALNPSGGNSISSSSAVSLCVSEDHGEMEQRGQRAREARVRRDVAAKFGRQRGHRQIQPLHQCLVPSELAMCASRYFDQTLKDLSCGMIPNIFRIETQTQYKIL